MKKIITTALLFMALMGASQEKNKGLIYFEADPLAYINKGYSLHLGYENFGMRFDLTYVKVDFPPSFELATFDTDKFDMKTNIIGFKIDLLSCKTDWRKNLFVGLDVNHQTQNFNHIETNKSMDLSTFNVGLRTGYKIPIYKGFYVTPWAAVWKNVLDEQSYQAGEDKISTNPWDYIVTVHLGYAIKL